MATVTKTAFKIQFTNAGFNGERLTYRSMLEKITVPFLPLKLAGAAEQRLVYATQEPSVMNQTASRGCEPGKSAELHRVRQPKAGITTGTSRGQHHTATALHTAPSAPGARPGSCGILQRREHVQLGFIRARHMRCESCDRSRAYRGLRQEQRRARAASCALEGQQLEEAEGVP